MIVQYLLNENNENNENNNSSEAEIELPANIFWNETVSRYSNKEFKSNFRLCIMNNLYLYMIYLILYNL